MEASKRNLNINDSTKMPISWVLAGGFTLLLTYGGGIMWLTTMHSDVAQAQRDIYEQKNSNKEVAETVRHLDHSVTLIMVKMKIPDPDEK